MLAVTGDANIDGNIVFQFIDGFAPNQGDTYLFLDVDGQASSFLLSNSVLHAQLSSGRLDGLVGELLAAEGNEQSDLAVSLVDDHAHHQVQVQLAAK